jgi:ADP-ribose pyrophosphatase
MECARRELEEETGFRAGKMTALSQIHILPAYSDEKIHLYLATDLTVSEQHLDADEIIRVKKYPLPELIRMIDNGLITDGLTIISILTVVRHINALP